MKMGRNIYEQILFRASLRKRTIGIGILNGQKPEALYPEALKYADVIPVKTVEELIKLLRSGQIEGIVRGQIQDKYLLFDKLREKDQFEDYRCSIIRDVCGRIFFFGPTGLTEGNCLEDRKSYIKKVFITGELLMVNRILWRQSACLIILLWA